MITYYKSNRDAYNIYKLENGVVYVYRGGSWFNSILNCYDIIYLKQLTEEELFEELL